MGNSGGPRIAQLAVVPLSRKPMAAGMTNTCTVGKTGYNQ